MGHIFYVMGKSASGKDTIYKILRERLPQIRTVVPYTTRPIRAGERDGVEYYFVTGKRLADLEKQGKIIEKRTYQTIYGPWSYATVDDGQIDLGSHDYFMIGTLESYEGTRNYFGADVLVPLYIEVEDGERSRFSNRFSARIPHFSIFSALKSASSARKRRHSSAYFGSVCCRSRSSAR